MMAWFKAEAAKAGFADVDVMVPTRAERKLEQAESRRAAKERKLERRRA